ncbi:hypothetical protein ACFYOY_00255 [Streptomyces sp. NPDC007875]|uniref:hypothetical protein n=1 Tax=Streptomyces sp. NPDC007875 TaxID=3364783 RepID=UPI0036AF9BAF
MPVAVIHHIPFCAPDMCYAFRVIEALKSRTAARFDPIIHHETSTPVYWTASAQPERGGGNKAVTPHRAIEVTLPGGPPKFVRR